MRSLCRLLGCLLRGEARPLVVSIAKRMLCVYEVSLGLSKPVGSAPGHGINIADRRESWGGDRTPGESGPGRPDRLPGGRASSTQSPAVGAAPRRAPREAAILSRAASSAPPSGRSAG